MNACKPRVVSSRCCNLRQDPGRAFAVRAVTRDALSKASLALADLGAEVVQCNIDDKEQVKEAMKGAYGAFCITFFWDHFSPEKECAHAKIYAEAAAETQALRLHTARLAFVPFRCMLAETG